MPSLRLGLLEGAKVKILGLGVISEFREMWDAGGGT